MSRANQSMERGLYAAMGKEGKVPLTWGTLGLPEEIA